MCALFQSGPGLLRDRQGRDGKRPRGGVGSSIPCENAFKMISAIPVVMTAHQSLPVQAVCMCAAFASLSARSATAFKAAERAPGPQFATASTYVPPARPPPICCQAMGSMPQHTRKKKKKKKKKKKTNP
eukprot:TRINITY_DN3457_c0_g1_i3.p1 TRINITY_DN3457_c0_g1~~TRINITY_DN3457_c0_g1_i3.p1  ORF type:complete len:129 (-),score=0.62 TRINITY_DN3457_c0_g1_i3:27-413(-)